MSEMIYDTNIGMSLQTVRLVFGIDDYRKEMTVDVKGNCYGMDVIEAAVYNAHNKLDDDYGTPTIWLEKDGELIGVDAWAYGSSADDEFLGNILISAEITSIRKLGKDE